MEKTISLDRNVVSELAPYLDEKHISQSLLVSTILKDILFAEKYAKTNQTYAIVEQFLVSRQPYNVVRYISYVPHIQLEGIKHEEIHRDAN